MENDSENRLYDNQLYFLLFLNRLSSAKHSCTAFNQQNVIFFIFLSHVKKTLIKTI